MSTEQLQPDPQKILMREVKKKLSPREFELYKWVMETTPPRTLIDAKDLMGWSKNTVYNYWNRIKKKLGCDPIAEARALGKVALEKRKSYEGAPSAIEQLRAVSPEVLSRLLEMKAEKMLRSMSDQKIEDANLGELARATRELLSQRAVLRGEPTQYLAVDHRVKLMDLMPMLAREAQRRGFTFTADRNGEIRDVKKLKPAERALEAKEAEAVTVEASTEG